MHFLTRLNYTSFLEGRERDFYIYYDFVPISEHPQTPAGENSIQTIDLGPVESFTGDDDDATGSTDDDDDDDAGLDDDDAGSGCEEGCSVTGEVSSEETAPFVAGGFLASGIIWGRRRRRA